MEFYHEPKFWVGLAFVTFIALIYKKAAGAIFSALDSRSQKIKTELDQAALLRAEAEAVLDEYKRRQSEYLKEAEEMLAKAREDARQMEIVAEKELRLAIEIRTKNAMDRIAQEETKAIDEVRHHVVDIALAAARSIIAERAGKSDQSNLIKLAMADIERKIH